MKTALEEVMDIRGKGMPATDEITITNADPILPTRFRIADTCSAVLAGVGTAVNDIWEMKTGRRQKIAIDARKVAAGLGSSRYLQNQGPDGKFRDIVNENHEKMIKITQPWPTKDGRWVLPHFGLPNLQARMTKLLGCEPTPESVSKAVAQWNALDLEAAIDEARVCGGMVRTNAEWLATEHGKVLAAKPIVEIIKIADSDPEPLPEGDRPLSGIRALDLTRILAGPVAARTLAENGAEVLMIAGKDVPQIAEHVMDTSHGKRSCFLELKTPEGVATLKELVRGADVFSQGYRPGIMAKLGFAPEQLAEIRPGIICCSISCYGADGPFSHRGGWEQVAQTMTGICQEGSPERPKLLPAAACDYTTGYLGAYGMLLALARRAREGGSYHVRVSLCQSGMFVYRQGKTAAVDPNIGLSDAELDTFRTTSHPASGPLRHISPIIRMSETQPHWARPTPVLGGDEPAWPDAAAAKAAE